MSSAGAPLKYTIIINLYKIMVYTNWWQTIMTDSQIDDEDHERIWKVRKLEMKGQTLKAHIKKLRWLSTRYIPSTIFQWFNETRSFKNRWITGRWITEYIPCHSVAATLKRSGLSCTIWFYDCELTQYLEWLLDNTAPYFLFKQMIVCEGDNEIMNIYQIYRNQSSKKIVYKDSI